MVEWVSAQRGLFLLPPLHVMANLPVEIWLQIIEDLRPDDDGLPIIGVNAAWTVIYGTPFPGSSESPTTNAVLSALHTSRYADLQSLRL